MLTPKDLQRAGLIASRAYSFNQIDEMLDFAEQQHRYYAEVYAYWSSVCTTLKGEKASGMLEGEIHEAAKKHSHPKSFVHIGKRISQ